MAPQEEDNQDAVRSPTFEAPTSPTGARDTASDTARSPPSQRRVSFHESTNSLPRFGSRMATLAQEAESNADETTAIMGNEQGGRKNYNTQDPGTVKRRSNASEISPRGGNRANRSTHVQDHAYADAHDEDESPQDANGNGVKHSYWKSVLLKYGSIELENKGSVARDHLALERTFLAWLRTSLAFASIGIAVTQLFRLNTALADDPTEGELKLRHLGKPLGGTFLAIGILTLLLGFHRYFESQHYVILGKFPASRGSVVLLTFVAAALIISSFVVIITVAPSAVGSA